MSRKNRGQSIRKDGFRERVIEQKKNEIRNMMQDLAGKIISIDDIIETGRALRFNVNITGKKVIIAFIIWTDERNKDNDLKTPQFARFVFRLNEDFKNRVLNYLEGIQNGCLTETKKEI